MRASRFVWVVAGVIVVGLSAIIAVSIPQAKTYSDCRAHSSAENKKNSERKKPGIFVCAARTIRVDAALIELATTATIAIFTIVLGITTVYLWEAGERQIVLAQRPRLRVRNVVHRPPRPSYEIRYPFEQGHHIGGQFYLVNVGGTAAKVVEMGCWVEWFRDDINLPMERPYEGKRGNISATPRVEPGQSVPISFSSDKAMDWQAEDITPMQGSSPRTHLYVMGWVFYKDDIGIARFTSFCRKFDPRRAKFFAVDDPDYEHEE